MSTERHLSIIWPAYGLNKLINAFYIPLSLPAERCFVCASPDNIQGTKHWIFTIPIARDNARKSLQRECHETYTLRTLRRYFSSYAKWRGMCEGRNISMKSLKAITTCRKKMRHVDTFKCEIFIARLFGGIARAGTVSHKENILRIR